jgi:hypothetical protein
MPGVQAEGPRRVAAGACQPGDGEPAVTGYDPAADPVHGSGWNSAARWGGWHWDDPRGAEHFRRCSFCGSISPDDLAAEPSWRASWADRKYGWPHKFYVEGVVNRSPETLRIISALTAGQEDQMERMPGYQWYPVADIPPGTDVSGWRLEDGHYSHVALGSDKTHFVKFYTIHLADPVIGGEVKDAIERRSGMRFTFEDGSVRWWPFLAAG